MLRSAFQGAEAPLKSIDGHAWGLLVCTLQSLQGHKDIELSPDVADWLRRLIMLSEWQRDGIDEKGALALLDRIRKRDVHQPRQEAAKRTRRAQGEATRQAVARAAAADSGGRGRAKRIVRTLADQGLELSLATVQTYLKPGCAKK